MATRRGLEHGCGMTHQKGGRSMTHPTSARSSFTWFCAALLVTPSILLTAGCDHRRDDIQAAMSTLNGQKEIVRQTLSNQQSSLEAMNQRLLVEQAQLREYNAGVQGYILDHKMAVAAIAAGIGGTGTAISHDSTYSEEVKEVGAAAALIAIVWALNNMDEVSDVVKTLNQADAHVKTLKADIAQTSSAIEQQRQAIQGSQASLGVMGQKVSALQAQLDQL